MRKTLEIMRLFENNELTILLYMYVFAFIYLFCSSSTFYFYTKKGFLTQSVFSFNPPPPDFIFP